MRSYLSSIRMNKQIYEWLQDKEVRISALEHNFPLFHAYHFGWEYKPFHIDWMKSLQSEKNTFLEWFRASRKTTLVKGFVVWCIAYKKYNYIVWMSYEDTDSTNNVTDIAKMLFKTSIVDDYGKLFPVDAKPEDFAKKTQGNFNTTNKIKVQSKSISQSTRWLNTYDQEGEQTERPDLLIMDDIDVLKSVMNPRIIEQNERKILGEVFGALDPLGNKRIVLGNTILEDWTIPRLRSKYKHSPNWDIFRQPLVDDKGTNYRPEEFTDEIIAKLKEEWPTAFWQNYLLKPATSWSGIFIRDYFDYFLLSHFEQVDGILKKSDMRCWIFCDPAFSTSASSDDAVVIWWAEHKISKWYYVIDWYSDIAAPSKTINALIVMYNKMTMDWFKVDFISVENAVINKQQTEFIVLLKAELLKYWINCPVYLYTPKLKKEQRVQDNLEPVMSQKGVKFNRNISQPDFIPKMEAQLLQFPNGDHDDHPDCLSQMVEVFRKRVEKKEEPIRQTQYSSITWLPIQKDYTPDRPRPLWMTRQIGKPRKLY